MLESLPLLILSKFIHQHLVKRNLAYEKFPKFWGSQIFVPNCCALWVWPVLTFDHKFTENPKHRYLIEVDCSSGQLKSAKLKDKQYTLVAWKATKHIWKKGRDGCTQFLTFVGRWSTADSSCWCCIYLYFISVIQRLILFCTYLAMQGKGWVTFLLSHVLCKKISL